MSTATLTSLLDYLYGTLSSSNMRWVGEHLIEQANKQEKEQGYDLTPFTMDEINAMLDEAEADFEAGRGIPHEQVMREMDEEIECWEQEKKEMAEAI
jgi:predicted transcriptional regulator